MATQLFANNAKTVLASGVSAVATSLTVTAGTGLLFPVITGSDYFLATLCQLSVTGEINFEIVKVTARTSDVFTIVRAQEGTTGLVYVTGDKVELRLTKETMGRLRDFTQTGAGAVARTLQSKVEEGVSLTDYLPAGYVTDGSVDYTTHIQAAITANYGRKLFIPAGLWQTTANLLIVKTINIVGEGHAWRGTPGTITASNFYGSWLWFNHPGIGITTNTSVDIPLSNVVFSNFGTVRNQPAISGAWTPNANDWDFYNVSSNDVHFNDMLLLNPTKGIYHHNAGAGRLYVNTLKAHAFQVGIKVDGAYDVCYITNVHFWPFWADASNVHDYTMGNLDGFMLGRIDNPKFVNIFTIFARAGMRFFESGSGTANKIKVVNADFDRGAFGIYTDPTATTGFTGQLANFTHHGETGFAGSKAVYIRGDNANISICNFSSGYTDQNTIRLEGTGNVVNLAGQVSCKNYNQTASTFPAIEVYSGNTARIVGHPDIAGGGAGAKYGGAGDIYVDDWISYTPTITSGSGALTAASGSGMYRARGNTLEYKITATITTNGTGAGNIQATLPWSSASSAGVSTGVGRATLISGKMLQTLVTASSSKVIIHNYDNTYPASTGEVLVISGNYKID